MKIKISIFLILFISTVSSPLFSQKQYTVGKETIYVPGNIVSSIKLVDIKNRPLGNILTHSFFATDRAVFTHITIEKNTPRLLILQVISKDAVKGLVPDIDVKKALINPEERTNPKNYWTVSVGFRKENNDVAEIGSTEYYTVENGTIVKKNYLGTSYVLSFITKKLADEFATKIKAFANK
jgi:hypothetical protein